MKPTREEIVKAIEKAKWLEAQKVFSGEGFDYTSSIADAVMKLYEEPEQKPEWEEKFLTYLTHNDKGAWMAWNATPIEIRDFIRDEFKMLHEELNCIYFVCYGRPMKIDDYSEFKEVFKKRGVI